MPEPVTDLRVHQSGAAVVVHFTLPRRATDGQSLSGPPRVEIYREFPSAAGAAAHPAPAAESAATVGGNLVDRLGAAQLAPDLAGNTVTWTDTLTAAEFQAHRGQQVRYRVRTAAGGSKWSAASKGANLTLHTPPRPVRDLTATIVGDAVELRWQPPALSPAPGTFLIYRSQVGSGASAAGSPAALTATTGKTYRDTSAAPGREYRYTVRSVARVGGEEVESVDSARVVVRVPAMALGPPKGLTAIPIRKPDGSLEVDLSWEIGSEANLRGYNVYRSESLNGRGARLNAKVLAAPAFRDTTVVPGRSYSYTVTAVGPAGNESKASAPVTVRVPKVGSGS